MNNTKDSFIDVKQVSKMLGIGVSTVWAWHKKKADFPRKVSVYQSTRWSLNEVTAYFNMFKENRQCG